MAFHVAQVLALRSLIERDMCAFEEELSHNICKDCFNKALHVLKTDEWDTISSEHSEGLFLSLIDYFSRHVQLKLDSYIGKTGCFRAEGSEEILGHEQLTYRYSKKLLPTNIKVGDMLTRNQVIDLGIGQRFAHYSANDFVQGDLISSEYNISGVMSSSTQMAVLAGYFGKESFTSPVMVEYPMLQGQRIEEVLKFRDQEWHHFRDFRMLIEDGVRDGGDVERMLEDSSAKIAGMVAKNARTLDKALVKEGAVAVAGIGVSIASAGVSGLVAAAIAVLGGGHFVGSIVPKLIDRFSEPEDVRTEKTYYAWKIKKKTLI